MLKPVFFKLKIIYICNIFAQIMDCGYTIETLGDVVLTTAHNHYWSRKKEKKMYPCKKVQVGNDQEKVQSERDSHPKNRGGE